MNRVEQWIYRTCGNASDREIAKIAGIGQSTLSRQRREGTVTVETAVKIARAYQTSVIPALLALDVVTEFDIREFASSNGVSDASDEVLIQEVLARMKRGSDLVDRPISEIENELERRRSIRSNKSASGVRVEEYDDDALIDRINAGLEPIAAQKRTDPLDENYT